MHLVVIFTLVCSSCNIFKSRGDLTSIVSILSQALSWSHLHVSLWLEAFAIGLVVIKNVFVYQGESLMIDFGINLVVF